MNTRNERMTQWECVNVYKAGQFNAIPERVGTHTYVRFFFCGLSEVLSCGLFGFMVSESQSPKLELSSLITWNFATTPVVQPPPF